MSCFVRFKCGFKMLQPYFSPHGLKVGRLLMKLLPASHILVYLGEGRWHGVMQKVPNWVVVKHFWANWWWNLPRCSWPRHVDEKRLGTRVETVVGDKSRWQDGGRLESSFWTLWMTCFQSSHCHESWFILVSVACCSCCFWVCCFGFSFYFFWMFHWLLLWFWVVVHVAPLDPHTPWPSDFPRSQLLPDVTGSGAQTQLLGVSDATHYGWWIHQVQDWTCYFWRKKT